MEAGSFFSLAGNRLAKAFAKGSDRKQNSTKQSMAIIPGTSDSSPFRYIRPLKGFPLVPPPLPVPESFTTPATAAALLSEGWEVSSLDSSWDVSPPLFSPEESVEDGFEEPDELLEEPPDELPEESSDELPEELFS